VININLNDIGKKFGKEWIFRKVNFEFPAGSRSVILGGNGSGKSTLLQIISGFITPNEGVVKFDGNADAEKFSAQVSLASPYLQLIDDFTVQELFAHLCKFRKFKTGVTSSAIFDLLDLPDTGAKPIKHFSSGMKQKLRLGLAMFAETPLLLLDEPVSNLDKAAIQWYHQSLLKYSSNRTLIICSNAIAEEYSICDRQLIVTDYKTKINLV
jgi:ABC-type multidrug transport system ATPase subunit